MIIRLGDANISIYKAGSYYYYQIWNERYNLMTSSYDRNHKRFTAALKASIERLNRHRSR